MKYTKVLAFAAVAIMLTVPIGALFADADVSADAEKKNKTVDGVKAHYAKTDKEIDREKLLELFPLDYLAIMMSLAISSTGLNTDLFLSDSVTPEVTTFKMTYLEDGSASKVADNTRSDDVVYKVKGVYDLTYKFPEAHSYKEFITEGSDAKMAEAAEAFKAYFGETIAANTEITLSAKFEDKVSTIDIEKYVNISTGELVLSMHKMTMNVVTKIDEGKLKIGDKTMTFNVDRANYSTAGFDYSIGSDAKLDTKLEKASLIWDVSASESAKYKFGDKEVVYSPDSKELMKEVEKSKETMEGQIKDAKTKTVSQGLDILWGYSNGETYLPIVQNADVGTTNCSWEGSGLEEKKFKDSGFTTSTDNFGDVENAAKSVAPASGKSPVLFIVIAVVAVIVVAGAVFVVMKKKSA